MISYRNLAILCLLFEASKGWARQSDDEKTWVKFVENSSVLGLVAGESTMKAVIETMGALKIQAKGEGEHELARLCYKNTNSKLYAVFLTGYLHDFDTLYGLELHLTSPKDNCVISKKLDEKIATPGGLYVGMSEKDLTNKLGPPSKNRLQQLKWKFDHHTKFKTPKIFYQEVGPSNARYKQKMVVTGQFHNANIDATADGKIIVKLEILHGRESDFEIQ